MGVDLNPNIHLLMDRSQQKAFAGKVPDQVLSQALAQTGHELVIESNDGTLSTVKVDEYLANPQNYQSDKPAYLSIDAGGRTVMVSVAVLSKDNLLNALGKALSEVETSRIQGVTTGDFQQRLIALAARVRGAQAPTDVPIENAASKSLTVTAVEGGPMTVRKDDIESSNWLQSALKDADARVQQRSLEPEAKKQAVIDELLSHFEVMNPLAPDQKQALSKFLNRFDLKDLDRVSFQGVEGEGKALGLTGSGQEGHYTNSILTSLRQLAITGRLKPETLAVLDKLATQPLHADLASQRLDLVRSALQDVAYPACINQHAKGTCVATAIQIKFVIAEPARYLEMLSDLASPAGKVRPALMHAPGTIEVKAETRKDERSGRSVSGRLMQPALMEYANGQLTYNNQRDLHNSGAGGLSSLQTARLTRALYGERDYEQIQIPGFGPGRQKALERIAATIAHGETVPVSLSWSTGYHEIVLTDLDKEANLAYFLNPWGETQTMPLDDLLTRLETAMLPKRMPTGSQPAIYGLPAPANQHASYVPIASESFRTPRDEIKYYPELRGLSDERKNLVQHLLKDLQLPRESCKGLAHVIKGGHFGDEMFAALAKAKTGDEAFTAVGTYFLLEKAIASGNYSLAAARDYLAAEPLKHLNYVEYGAWIESMEALSGGHPEPDIGDFTTLLQSRQADCKALAERFKAAGLSAEFDKAIHLLRWSDIGPDLIERLKSSSDKQDWQRLIKLGQALEAALSEGKLGDANALKGMLANAQVLSLPAAGFDTLLTKLKEGQAAALIAFGYQPPAATTP